MLTWGSMLKWMHLPVYIYMCSDLLTLCNMCTLSLSNPFSASIVTSSFSFSLHISLIRGHLSLDLGPPEWSHFEILNYIHKDSFLNIENVSPNKIIFTCSGMSIYVLGVPFKPLQLPLLIFCWLDILFLSILPKYCEVGRRVPITDEELETHRS